MIVSGHDNKITLKELSGVICIDIWENYSGIPLTWLDNIDKHVNFLQFDSIIAANYELALDSSDDLSQYNTLKCYSWSTYRPEILLPVMKEARKRKTHSWLKNKFSSNSFLILDTVGMKIHVESVVPHIKNWLIVGGGWQTCLHQRPLGLKNMMHLPYNFFVAPWSIYNNNSKPIERSQFEQDTMCWIDRGNNFFQLNN
jgi:hypothetical protein